MTWSEERLHRWLERRSGRPGDDAVLVRAPSGRVVACTDQCIAGVHFEHGTSAARVGAKAAGRALSDLAASAARPRALLASVAAPASAAEAWIRGCLAALDRRGRAFGAPLVGGDLALADGPLSIAVTALGELEHRGGAARLPSRDRARPGQVVLLTGPVGGSRLGRHLAIEPRVALGRALYKLGATALMDVSDGLARDLARLARASGVRIELERIPVHRDARRAAERDGRSAQWHALHDGEDHELLATLSRAAAERAQRAAVRGAKRARAARTTSACPSIIGRVVAGEGLWILGCPWDGAGGWVHGESKGGGSAP